MAWNIIAHIASIIASYVFPGIELTVRSTAQPRVFLSQCVSF